MAVSLVEMLLTSIDGRMMLIIHYADHIIRHIIIMSKLEGDIKIKKEDSKKCLSFLECVVEEKSDTVNKIS